MSAALAVPRASSAASLEDSTARLWHVVHVLLRHQDLEVRQHAADFHGWLVSGHRDDLVARLGLRARGGVTPQKLSARALQDEALCALARAAGGVAPAMRMLQGVERAPAAAAESLAECCRLGAACSRSAFERARKRLNPKASG